MLLKKYIVLEGMDGSGKETQSKELLKFLNAAGHDYIRAAFPDYESESGQIVREYLREGNGSPKGYDEILSDSTLYTLNRFQYFIDNNLFRKEARIIFDRWTTSNLLYQTLHMTEYEKERYLNWLEYLEYRKLKLPEPSIVFVLRCSETLSIENITKRNQETDFFESVDMQNKVRENINYFVEKRDWIPIDVDNNGVMRPIHDIRDEILQHLGIDVNALQSTIL